MSWFTAIAREVAQQTSELVQARDDEIAKLRVALEGAQRQAQAAWSAAEALAEKAERAEARLQRGGCCASCDGHACGETGGAGMSNGSEV